jgi:HPt (histidine-containing phosphotransfer) domain-containing protein
MTLREFYGNIGGSYEDTLRRLINEKLMRKYLLKFAESQDYDHLLEAVEAQRWEEAFRHSHNLKGVCLNLGLDKLADASSRLCELLRGGSPDSDPAPLTAEVQAAHAQVMEGLRALDE